MILQLEEMIALAYRVKEWDLQIRQEHRVSVRGDDFQERTRTIYHNTYCGNVPATGNPAVQIRITQVDGEYFDFGKRFEEDQQLIITAHVDDERIGYGGFNAKPDPKLGFEHGMQARALSKLFIGAQKNYHAKFRDYNERHERQETRASHNVKCAYNRAKKILEAKK